MKRALFHDDASPRLAIGLMSGTSADGIDAALVEIAALVVLLVKEKKAGFWLLCGCYLLSFLTGVIGGITGGTGGTGILLSVGASAIGSVLIPGITWLFLRKDLPNMR